MKNDERIVHQMFAKIAEINPAGIYTCRDGQSTLKAINDQSNRLAHLLLNDHRIRPSDVIGLLIETSSDHTIAALGIMKSGKKCVLIDPSLPEESIRHQIEAAHASALISTKKFVRLINELQWSCTGLQTYVMMDSTDVYSEIEPKSQLMDRDLWDYIAETASDEIAEGGWVNSYSGMNFSNVEMEEYTNNIVQKLLPYLNHHARVLEIGCASGLSMFSLAPHVAFYYGTDLSSVMIEKNELRIRENNIRNIKVECIPAP